ncbi:MAG: peptide chain release factor H [Pseudomonadota bacterium]
MIWLQLSANTGPLECCLAVSKALAQLESEAKSKGVRMEVIELVDGAAPGTCASVLLELDDPSGTGLDAALARRWSGSILWICQSPYRKLHKRKNWFISGASFAPPQLADEGGEIRYEATRASGPGGQHVNKTDSAIRATHLASGLSVKVQTERSQFANKKLAGQLLASKLADIARADAGKHKSDRRLQHHQGERGNAARVFVGTGFLERRD